ncbi:hypothetical protein LIV57_05710 [Chryseobacterium sp. X308]|uniref:hypothetical protein n=1 Tax=Chryseobacterium sp. X308 TaxID=2884873 RepID=UPI001D142695|nr:hypothetical protein [Chryseobacterium sp. X308]MCC3214758.1 hypothetical protein [Chryseobacterium sp. X308]
MKATMLAMGGLSGGISSTIAGGNFWEGFRQGIITSGLNHLAHISVLTFGKDPLQKILEKHNIDPTKKATQETLNQLKIIFKEYWDNSAQWAEFATEETVAQWEGKEYKGFLSLKKGMIYSTAGHKDYGITNPINGKVLLSTDINNYALGGSFIHEMIHSIDVMSGVQSFWNNFSIGHDYIESRAYMEEAKWNGGYINDIGHNHIMNSMQIHLSLFNFIR